MTEKIDHPAHYGGAKDPYEAIKVIRAWGLGFALGNAAKYICRAGRKPGEEALDDLKKARWYLDNEAEALGGAPETGPSPTHYAPLEDTGRTSAQPMPAVTRVRLEAERDEAREAVQRIAHKLDEAREGLAEAAKLREAIDELHDEVGTWRDRFNRAAAERDEAIAKAEGLQTALDEERGRVDILLGERDEAQADERQALAEAEKLREEVKALRRVLPGEVHVATGRALDKIAELLGLARGEELPNGTYRSESDASLRERCFQRLEGVKP